ncbi:MAG: lipid-A-disaccharide synthase [Bacteroidales bacterium]|jgi:lipid-A-disaccharide synthase|nr:lipid-A-disaccharide synthase [Bacteroidales bacterium]
MRYFIIAGEQSGDLHGSNLITELHAADKSAEVICWGGDLMESAGAELLMHYRETAFMGFTVILKNLGTISHNLNICKRQITEYKPDVIILIDYPGFNLRIAKFAKEAGFRVFYYISPKFWAWNERRVKNVKKYVDRMFIIFPFETEFYRKYDILVKYHGNPLVDEIENKKATMPSREEIISSLQLGKKPVVAMLAGSRKHEVKFILPQMIRIVKHFPEYQFVLAGVKNMPDEIYQKIIGDQPVRLIKEKTYEILSVAEAALVKSGTATLEAALFGVPEVVCYKGDFFSMLIALIMMKVKYISLVNLIMNKEVVKEILGYDVNEKNILRELRSILPGGDKRERMIEDYKVLTARLGPAGASARIAREMFYELKSKVTGIN